MSTTATSAITSATSTGADSTLTLPTKSLNQQDFLKLLVAQMSAQDPLNPTTDTQFIAQMAQFTSLEQTTAMQTELSKMRGDQEFVQANGMIGRSVVVQTGQDTTTLGVVTGVQMVSGSPKLIVNDQAYDLSSVLSVTASDPSATQPVVQTAPQPTPTVYQAQ